MSDGHEHSPHLAHHFDSPDQQVESGKLGMWLFLVTEVLLFGGLFCAYAVYRSIHPEVFVYAHHFLSKLLGGINTVILITSGLTMALAVRFAQTENRRGLVLTLALTFLGGAGFMSIKYVEYKHKWEDGLLWGTRYAPTHKAPAAVPGPVQRPAPAPAVVEKTADGKIIEKSTIAPAPEGPAGLRRHPPDVQAPAGDIGIEPANVHIFFGIYFLMTGLHGLHVLAGMGVLVWLLRRAIRGEFNRNYYAPVDLGGLYWHLVDIIWIFLFPLFYLIT